MKNKEEFSQKLLKWYKNEGRDFPWRDPAVTPYEVLISEIFLQRTRAEKVKDVYQHFIKKYPSPRILTSADLSEITENIRKLGLQDQKAIKLKKLSIKLIEGHDGDVPMIKGELLSLPGVGLYIANAVRCFAFNCDEPLLDTNTARVVERVFSIKATGEERKKLSVWENIKGLIPKGKAREFNYALIDFGALICKPDPLCEICFLTHICRYFSKCMHAQKISDSI